MKEPESSRKRPPDNLARTPSSLFFLALILWRLKPRIAPHKGLRALKAEPWITLHQKWLVVTPAQQKVTEKGGRRYIPMQPQSRSSTQPSAAIIPQALKCFRQNSANYLPPLTTRLIYYQQRIQLRHWK